MACAGFFSIIVVRRNTLMDFDLNKRYCYYFNEISKIPHGSRNEKALSDYICAFAEKHGLKFRQDHVWNVMIDKPASKGFENSEPVILQAHMDMVCEKNNDVEHDFEKDPLDLYVEDGWLKARGTTLGGDDGHGVAYMLAILEDPSIAHPPLECIFTVQEEIGLLGMAELRAEDLHGHRYISLDGGGLNVTETSCAGAVSPKIIQKIEWEPCDQPEYELAVTGLQGGHSGSLIHLERGNANIIAGRILKEAETAGSDITLTYMQGGLKENALPRESIFRFVSDTPADTLNEIIGNSIQDIKDELQFSDAGVAISLTAKGNAARRFPKTISDRLINYIFLMPHGFLHRSMAVENLTTASLNLGVISTQDDTVVFEIMARAAENSQRFDICRKLQTLADVLELECDMPEGYPGWAYTPESELRQIMKNVLERHGLTYVEEATHGGLECGIVKGLDPKMDIITFGPVNLDIHCPDERLNLQSFDDGWEILLDILNDCR